MLGEIQTQWSVVPVQSPLSDEGLFSSGVYLEGNAFTKTTSDILLAKFLIPFLNPEPLGTSAEVVILLVTSLHCGHGGCGGVGGVVLHPQSVLTS